MNSSKLTGSTVLYIEVMLTIFQKPEAVPDTALTVDVACCFFDGAFRDESRIFCITWHHHGFTPRSLSWICDKASLIG